MPVDLGLKELHPFYESLLKNLIIFKNQGTQRFLLNNRSHILLFVVSSDFLSSTQEFKIKNMSCVSVDRFMEFFGNYIGLWQN